MSASRACPCLLPGLLLGLVLAACAHAPPPAPVPTAPASPAAPVAFAPHTHSLEQLRAAMPVGAELHMRVEQPGQPTVVQRWTVTAADASTCTIAAQVYDEAGALVADEGAGTSTWEELYAHADLPADRTSVTDEVLDTPLGRLATRRYLVTQAGDDGALVEKELHFAVDIPGPPVRMVVRAADGTELLRLTQVLRRPLPGG